MEKFFFYLIRSDLLFYYYLYIEIDSQRLASVTQKERRRGGIF